MVIFIADGDLNLISKCNSSSELVNFINNKASEGIVHILSTNNKVKEFIWTEDDNLNFKSLHKEYLTRLKNKSINSFKIIVITSNTTFIYHVYLPVFYKNLLNKKQALNNKKKDYTIPESFSLYQEIFSSIIDDSDLPLSIIEDYKDI